MTLERYTILGQPVPKGRPRVALLGGHAMAYTPKRTELWEATAATIIRAERGFLPSIEGPVKLSVEAVCTRPARLNRKKDSPYRLWRPTRPDVDNICKAVMDSLVLAGVLADDAQVAYLIGLSWYAAKGEGPRVEFSIGPVFDVADGRSMSTMPARAALTEGR